MRKRGRPVTVRGIIGGRKDALSEGSGVFVMMDDSVENACLSEGRQLPDALGLLLHTPGRDRVVERDGAAC